jgi:PhzF family phenazine biosynthesis protein
MDIPFYQVDAFTDRVFSGNPAGVCLLETWPEDPLLQAVAAENNLSETAFLVPAGREYELRWFTPKVEVDLCGHATLAAAHVLLAFIHPQWTEVAFQTRQSGRLTVFREGDRLVMDFPKRPPLPCPAPEGFSEIMGLSPLATYRSRDLMAVFETEKEVRSLTPDLNRLAALDLFAVIVTAPGKDCDFVSRFFAPRVGVPEDPVTGSAHCTLVPYWSERLNKKELHARQVSPRGGELFCRLQGDRVFIGGRAKTFLTGTIRL